MMLRSVLDGGRYFEGPRWHAGRLWFVDCMDRTLLSLDASGWSELHAKFDDDTPCGLGILPDGRLIVLTNVPQASDDLRRRQALALRRPVRDRQGDDRRHDRRRAGARLCRRPRLRFAAAAG